MLDDGNSDVDVAVTVDGRYIIRSILYRYQIVIFIVYNRVDFLYSLFFFLYAAISNIHCVCEGVSVKYDILNGYTKNRNRDYIHIYVYICIYITIVI